MKRVLGLGNALTDVLIPLKSDEMLTRFELPRGSMQLVDAEFQRLLGEATQKLPHTRSVGGSASNTLRALAHLGVPGGYVGKVGEDEIGDFFEQSMTDLAIKPTILRSPKHSGICYSLISPDGERTLVTHLGAALELAAEEISPALFAGYDYLYIEGYLVQNHDLIQRAVELAQEAGLQVVLDLASYNVVEENLDFLKTLIRNSVDILFANEQESAAFTGETNPLEALDLLSHYCSMVVAKLGKRGAYVKYRGEVDHVDVMYSARRVDSTGAGDYYSAGFLYGLCRGLSIPQCGTIGAIAAGKVIEQVGTTLRQKSWDEIQALVKRVEQGTLIF